MYFIVRGGIYCDNWDYSYLVEGVSDVMCDQSSCVTMSIVFELGLVWVASRAHFIAFGMVVGYAIWAKLSPCHLV